VSGPQYGAAAASPTESPVIGARVDGLEGVSGALEALREAGVPRERIEVLSSLPLPPHVVGGEWKSKRLLRYTFTGSLLGLAIGIGLSPGTAFIYPLVVGAQPLISPPSLIIIYELTMWVTVLATITGFIYMTRVRPGTPRYARVPHDHEILVVADVPGDLVPARVREALVAHGAELIDLGEVHGR
jgi:hypothetical protein